MHILCQQINNWGNSAKFFSFKTDTVDIGFGRARSEAYIYQKDIHHKHGEQCPYVFNFAAILYEIYFLSFFLGEGGGGGC